MHIFNQRLLRLTFLTALVLTTSLRYQPVLADVITEEQELLRLINQERASGNIPALNSNRLLSQVARNYSKEMMEHGFMNHISEVDGSTPSDRVRRSGYYDSYQGNIVIRENIALISGPAKAVGAHQAFMSSEGHRANLLASDVNEIGIGITEGTFQSMSTTIYVEVFAYHERSQTTTLSVTVNPRITTIQRGGTVIFSIHVDSNIPTNIVIQIINIPSQIVWRLDRSSGTTPLDASLTADTTSTPTGTYSFDIVVTGISQTRTISPIITVTALIQSTTSQTQSTTASSSTTIKPTNTETSTSSAHISSATATMTRTQSTLTTPTVITKTTATNSIITDSTARTDSTGVQATTSSTKISQPTTIETHASNTSSRFETQSQRTTSLFTSMRCIIATVAFGSEFSPEVQFLREFRDAKVMSTFAGRMFMVSFNTMYYSFSPQIASFVASQSFARSIVRVLILPLVAALRLAALVFDFAALDADVMISLCGLLASSLLGLAYGIPLALLPSLFRGARRPTNCRRKLIDDHSI